MSKIKKINTKKRRQGGEFVEAEKYFYLLMAILMRYIKSVFQIITVKKIKKKWQ